MKTFKHDLILKKDTIFKESIKVEGNIICKDIRYSLKVCGNLDCWNINCGNIDCLNIVCGNIVCWNIVCGNIDCGNIVCRNIVCWNIVCWNIVCGNIDCGNIDCLNIVYCNKIKLKNKEGKVKAKALIQNRFELKVKEQKI